MLRMEERFAVCGIPAMFVVLLSILLEFGFRTCYCKEYGQDLMDGRPLL